MYKESVADGKSSVNLEMIMFVGTIWPRNRGHLINCWFGSCWWYTKCGYKVTLLMLKESDEHNRVHLSIISSHHPSSPAPIPAVTGTGAGYSLDRGPVRHRADISTHSHLRSRHIATFCWYMIPFGITCRCPKPSLTHMGPFGICGRCAKPSFSLLRVLNEGWKSCFWPLTPTSTFLAL